jgi:hypothetical protein
MRDRPADDSVEQWLRARDRERGRGGARFGLMAQPGGNRARKRSCGSELAESMTLSEPWAATDHLTIWLRVGILGGNGHAPRCGSYGCQTFARDARGRIAAENSASRHMRVGSRAPLAR